jgi:hypothetical protein
MSYPREIASHSSSASKSSPKSQKRQSRSLLPSPHFEEPHLRPSVNDEAIEASALAEESATEFQPFFSLIENPSTSEHHHPTVHYIFADDDADIITEAACRALAQDDNEHAMSYEDEENILPVPADGVREHYILLDVQPGEAGNRYEITKAQSLSSEWQVTSASISTAPTMDGNAAESGEGLMLKIEGIGALLDTEMREAGKQRKESLQQQVERFEKGLAEIRKMVNGGLS